MKTISDEAARGVLNTLALKIKTFLAAFGEKQIGFTLMIYDFYDPESTGKYVSNSESGDILKALRSYVSYLQKEFWTISSHNSPVFGKYDGSEKIVGQNINMVMGDLLEKDVSKELLELCNEVFLEKDPEENCPFCGSFSTCFEDCPVTKFHKIKESYGV